MNFMNYGNNGLNVEKIFLYQEDEMNRFCTQLYDRVVRNNELKDKDVLEVSSGQGGGASYIARFETYPGRSRKPTIQRKSIRCCHHLRIGTVLWEPEHILPGSQPGIEARRAFPCR